MRDDGISAFALVRVGEPAFGVETLSKKPNVLRLSPPVHRFGTVTGVSLAMQRLYPVFERIAKTDLDVLIQGESGTR